MYGPVTLYGFASQRIPLTKQFVTSLEIYVVTLQPLYSYEYRFGLFPVRSPLLRELLKLLSPGDLMVSPKLKSLVLVYFPPGTEMFHFPGFASYL